MRRLAGLIGRELAGMACTSTLPMAMRAAGMDLGGCFAVLLEQAAARAS